MELSSSPQDFPSPFLALGLGRGMGGKGGEETDSPRPLGSKGRLDCPNLAMARSPSPPLLLLFCFFGFCFLVLKCLELDQRGRSLDVLRGLTDLLCRSLPRMTVWIPIFPKKIACFNDLTRFCSFAIRQRGLRTRLAGGRQLLSTRMSWSSTARSSRMWSRQPCSWISSR